jgi:RimJ/RimL family protein N-acetyltransferase
MPVLATERLIVRPFEPGDLEACHQLLDVEAWQTGRSSDYRAEWLEWTVLSYRFQAQQMQPPFGDRAVVLKATGEVVGSVGLVWSLMPFGRLPSLGGNETSNWTQVEVGLFWATRSAYRNQGIATEAANALIDYAFSTLNLGRIIATTAYDNAASQAVMRRLGMSVERNPRPDPPWFQVVGVLHNTR